MKKGYKVTDVKREKKIGVAAENLEELIEKSCKKLGVSTNFFVYVDLLHLYCWYSMIWLCFEASLSHKTRVYPCDVTNGSGWSLGQYLCTLT